MVGVYKEGMGQLAYDELVEKLGIEGDSEEFIAAMKGENGEAE